MDKHVKSPSPFCRTEVTEYLGALSRVFKKLRVEALAIKGDGGRWLWALEFGQGQSSELLLQGKEQAFALQFCRVQGLRGGQTGDGNRWALRQQAVWRTNEALTENTPHSALSPNLSSVSPQRNPDAHVILQVFHQIKDKSNRTF